jgi:hypothetical protein
LVDNPSYHTPLAWHRVIASIFFADGFKGEWVASSVAREHSNEDEDYGDVSELEQAVQGR